MFNELAALATATHSEFLTDPSAVYQYQPVAAQAKQILEGVVELGEQSEFRKAVNGNRNKVMLLPIRVPSEQFEKPPILAGLISITRGSKTVVYQIDSIANPRSNRVELKLMRTTTNHIHRPKFEQ